MSISSRNYLCRIKAVYWGISEPWWVFFQFWNVLILKKNLYISKVISNGNLTWTWGLKVHPSNSLSTFSSFSFRIFCCRCSSQILDRSAIVEFWLLKHSTMVRQTRKMLLLTDANDILTLKCLVGKYIRHFRALVSRAQVFSFVYRYCIYLSGLIFIWESLQNQTKDYHQI
mgnify:CR=1 FL=1